ncbi:MAG TPA: cell division protein FtsL [Candidatus Binatia bacterium]|nr:cell division protein FtsL [Candidatus Binatia bacterium]
MAAEARAARAWGQPAARPSSSPVRRAGRWFAPNARRPDARAAHKRRAASGAAIGRAARGRIARVNVAAGLFFLAVGLFHVWTGLAVGQLGYALSDARALTERLDQELHELSIEYAAETTPGRLEEAARERLGLHPPAPGQVVILR